ILLTHQPQDARPRVAILRIPYRQDARKTLEDYGFGPGISDKKRWAKLKSDNLLHVAHKTYVFYNVMVFTSAATRNSAAVALVTSSTVKPGATSRNKNPSGVT